jgi:hypothetical protein
MRCYAPLLFPPSIMRSPAASGALLAAESQNPAVADRIISCDLEAYHDIMRIPPSHSASRRLARAHRNFAGHCSNMNTCCQKRHISYRCQKMHKEEDCRRHALPSPGFHHLLHKDKHAMHSKYTAQWTTILFHGYGNNVREQIGVYEPLVFYSSSNSTSMPHSSHF